MNAIILSRVDAEFINRTQYTEANASKQLDLIASGTPGLSWLTVVPDEVLHVIQGGDCSDDIFQRVSKEIYRRENLKSPKD